MVGIAVLALALSGSSPAPGPVWVGQFTTPGAPPKPWKMLARSGTRATQYRIARVDGRMAVEATVDKSMSVLARHVTIDLKKTPILCWRWYVDGPVVKADMTKKSGDDYAARIYVGFDMPDSALSGSTKFKLGLARALFGKDLPDAAVIYVWDNVHPVGTARKSAYNDRTQLIVSESGGGRAKSWVSERADIAADFAKAFTNLPGTPVGVALASDGDNTKSTGRAAFSDIHFVARNQPCRT
jgi:hypothetical protein